MVCINIFIFCQSSSEINFFTLIVLFLFLIDFRKFLIYFCRSWIVWIPGEYLVNSYVDKKYYEFPINLNTINKLFNKSFNPVQAKKFLTKLSIKNSKKINFETYLISKIGKKLYEKFYKNYTIKQWGVNPSQISVSVAKRITIRFDRNKEYIVAKYKLMPKNGFTEMFKKMISNKNISITLNKKYKFSKNDLNKYDSIVYTGPIDAFFNFKFEKLGWRSLKFDSQPIKKRNIKDVFRLIILMNLNLLEKLNISMLPSKNLDIQLFQKNIQNLLGIHTIQDRQK